MKLNIDIKNKKGSFESDVEKLAEKKMDIDEKNWKDKFSTKHNAKKEMLEIKHKQKMEIEEQRNAKKSWIQKIGEEKRRLKELELEEQRKREEEIKKTKRVKAIISGIMGIAGIIIMIGGSFLGEASGNPNSTWHMVSIIGLMIIFSIAFLWFDTPNQNKKKKR